MTEVAEATIEGGTYDSYQNRSEAAIITSKNNPLSQLVTKVP
jgi:hypothetical protein